jgi:hypothetical protein
LREPGVQVVATQVTVDGSHRPGCAQDWEGIHAAPSGWHCSIAVPAVSQRFWPAVHTLQIPLA